MCSRLRSVTVVGMPMVSRKLLRSRTPERYSLIVFGERFAASTWTRHDSATRERSVRLSTRFVAGVAQSAERFTRKYPQMCAVLRSVSAGRR
jgi:hypothetical protein